MLAGKGPQGDSRQPREINILPTKDEGSDFDWDKPFAEMKKDGGQYPNGKTSIPKQRAIADCRISAVWELAQMILEREQRSGAERHPEQIRKGKEWWTVRPEADVKLSEVQHGSQGSCVTSVRRPNEPRSIWWSSGKTARRVGHVEA